MDEETENNNVEIEEKKQKNKLQNTIRLIGFILLIFVVIGLGLLTYYSESFNIKWFFIITTIGLGLFLIIFFFTTIKDMFLNRSNKINEENKIPEPLTFGECQDVCVQYMKNRIGNKCRLNGTIEESTEEHGKISQSIYFKYFEGKFKNRDSLYPKYFFGMNMHYPERKAFRVEPNINQMTNSKRLLSKGPESPADTKETVSENTLTGTKITQKETSHKKLEKKKKVESNL